MNETKLGKIKTIEYGLERGTFLGLKMTFSMDGGSMGIGANFSFNSSEHNKYCKWTEVERNESIVKVSMYIAELLGLAKVDNVSNLRGIPVEVKMINNTFDSFRILTEVL